MERKCHFVDSRGLSSNTLYYTLVLFGGVIAGFAACITAGLSLRWLVVSILGLAVALAFFLARDKKSFVLFLFVFTVPFFIAKKIFSSDYPLLTGGPSALGLFLYDIPLIMLVIGLLSSKALRRDSSVNVPPALKPLLYYVMWSVVSTINAPEPTLAFIEVVWLCKMLLILVVVVNVVNDRGDVVLVITTLIAGLVLQELVTLLQTYLKVWFTFTGDTEQTTLKVAGEADIFRAGGTVGPHNVQSAYYVLLIPLAAAMYFVASNRWMKALVLSVVAGGILSVILTYSRNGYLSLFIALAVLTGLAVKKGLVTVKSLVLGTSAILAVSAALIVAKGDNVVQRVTSSAAIEPRIESIKIAINMIREHPVAGVGLNNFALVMQDPSYAPEGISSLQQTYFGGEFFGTVVHNKFLLVASEVGLIGLFFYVWLLLCCFRHSYSLFLRKDPLYFAVGAGIFAAFAGACVQMNSDIYNSDILITVLTVLIGLLFAVNRLASSEVG